MKGANDTLEQLAEARDKESWGVGQRPGEEPRLPSLRPHPAQHLLAQHDGRRRRRAAGGGRRRRARGRDRRVLRFVRGFKAQLTKAAATTQGSGWGVLAYEPVSGRLIVEQVYDHQGNVGQGAVPILVFDAWEHAFYLQYRNQKVDFIEAMWRVVNWQDVAKRYAAAKERADVLLLAP